MKRLRIVHKSPIAEFANAVHTYRDTVYRVWLITPWIGCYTDGSIDPLQVLIDALRDNNRCIVTVITRKPQPKAVWHQDALRLLKDNVAHTLFYCDSLHTKLYVIETGGMTAAMLGSPNLTPGGNTANIELALELRTTSLTRSDEISSTVQDLVNYARDLLSDDSVKIAT
ncbi:MAG: phospholipase D-like domain-containing protein [Ktedonobacteraceae bacterium]